jgi:hypothetical protein
LVQSDYLSESGRLPKLEEHGEEKSLEGVDGVWFILKNGNMHAFFNERAKVLDSA